MWKGMEKWCTVYLKKPAGCAIIIQIFVILQNIIYEVLPRQRKRMEKYGSY
jgi:hypothetical protein